MGRVWVHSVQVHCTMVPGMGIMTSAVEVLAGGDRAKGEGRVSMSPGPRACPGNRLPQRMGTETRMGRGAHNKDKDKEAEGEGEVVRQVLVPILTIAPCDRIPCTRPYQQLQPQLPGRSRDDPEPEMCTLDR